MALAQILLSKNMERRTLQSEENAHRRNDGNMSGASKNLRASRIINACCSIAHARHRASHMRIFAYLFHENIVMMKS